jgi:hypothetical protein
MPVNAIKGFGTGFKKRTWAKPLVPPPAAITDNMWALVPVSGGLRVDLAPYPDSGSPITEIQYRLDGGSAVTLANSGIILTTGTKDGQIRAVSARGPAAWSDIKTRTALAEATSMPTLRVAVTDYASGTNTTSHTVTAPVGRVVGDTLFVFAAVDANPTVTPSAGWTLIRRDTQAYTGSAQTTLLYTKVADGTSADNLAVTLGAAENFAAKTWCFVDDCQVVTTAPSNPTAGGGSSPNPPSVTLDRVRDALWFACIGYSGTGTALAAATEPAGYAYQGSPIVTLTNSAGVRLHAAMRELSVQTEDPATFGQVLALYTAYTVAVYKTVSALAPTLTDTPVLSGFAVAGTDIQVVDDIWSGASTSQRRYFKDGEAVAIASVYQIEDNAAVGEAFTSQIEATSASGVTTGWQAVDGTLIVEAGPALITAGDIIGQPAVGILLSLGGFQFVGEVAREYRWLRNGTPISGATSVTYLTQSADQNTTITADARAQDSAGRWSDRYPANGSLLVQPPPTAPPDAFTSGQAETFDVPSVGGNTIGISVLVEPSANGEAITLLWAEFFNGTSYGSAMSLPYAGIGDYQFTVPAGFTYTPRVWLENASGQGGKFILNTIDPSTTSSSTTNLTSVTFSGATFTISAPGTPGVSVPVGYSVDGVPYVVGDFDIVSDPTPAYVVPISGTDINRGKNGYQKDPVRGSNQRWDGRMAATFTAPTETFPLRMTPGSVFVKAVSRDNVTTSTAELRSGVVLSYAQIDCVAAAPGPNRFSSPAIWPSASTASRPLIEVDVDAIYATLPSYSTAGHSTVTWADVAFYIDKHAPTFGKIDSSVNSSGYEASLPWRFGSDSSSRNYGRAIAVPMSGLALGLIGDNWSAADKKAAIKRVVQLGSHWYWGFKGASGTRNPDGAHFQFYQMVMLLSLKWSGYTSEYNYVVNSLPGNWDQAIRATVTNRKGITTPHTGRALTDWIVSRKRLSNNVTGNTIGLAFDRAGAGGGPDQFNIAVYGLLLVHDLTGETRRIISPGTGIGNITSGTVAYKTLTVESEFTSAVTGDLFYLRPNYTLNHWDVLWTERNGGTALTNSFLGNAAASYFLLTEFGTTSAQFWASQLMALVALGVPVPANSRMENAIRLVLKTNLADTPSAVENFPNIIGSTITSGGAATDWPSDFYVSHGATIFAPWLTADVTAPVISGISSVSTSGTTATVTLTTNTAEGGVFWVTYPTGGATPSAAQIVAGQNSAGAAAPASGALDVSASGTVTLPVTFSSLTDIVAVFHQDFSNNNSNVLSRVVN